MSEHERDTNEAPAGNRTAAAALTHDYNLPWLGVAGFVAVALFIVWPWPWRTRR